MSDDIEQHKIVLADQFAEILTQFEGMTLEEVMQFRYVYFSGASDMASTFMQTDGMDRDEAKAMMKRATADIYTNLLLVREYLKTKDQTTSDVVR
jgi:hypothetical protein